MSETVQCQTDGRGVTTVRLDRPDKHNAFDDRLIHALTETLLAVNRDAAVRAVVLTGTGESFSAGADVNWMKAMAGYGEEENFEDALRLAELMSVLNGLGKPTVARVNGAAFGGGLGLIACCDVAIAVDTARFALTEVRLGLIPSVISPYVLAAIGARQARRYFLSGERMDAATAGRIGLLHEVVPAAELDDAVERQIKLLLKGAPVALRECKELISLVGEAGKSPRITLMRRTAELIAQLRVSPEGQEGLAAFLEKRPPGWIR